MGKNKCVTLQGINTLSYLKSKIKVLKYNNGIYVQITVFVQQKMLDNRAYNAMSAKSIAIVFVKSKFKMDSHYIRENGFGES